MTGVLLFGPARNETARIGVVVPSSAGCGCCSAETAVGAAAAGVEAGVASVAAVVELLVAAAELLFAAVVELAHGGAAPGAR
jgi:hypothetical protein